MANKVADVKAVTPNAGAVSASSAVAAKSNATATAGKSMTRNVTLAGLDADLENRVKAACWRLAAHGFDIRLRAWSGVQCDLLILGHGDSHGRVLDAAKQRQVPVLRITASPEKTGQEAHVMAATASVDQILVALRGLLDPSSTTPGMAFRAKRENVSGLLWLMVERRPSHGALHAISESYEVWLLPEQAQIWARSHSDLLGARERLLSAKWVFNKVRAGRVPDGPHLSFDEFFLDACMRASHRLPLFPRGSYRMRQHLDANLSRTPEVTALASQFSTRESVSTADLASIADVGQHHANAFLWATLASGALESCDGKTASGEPEPSLFERVLAKFSRPKP